MSITNRILVLDLDSTLVHTSGDMDDFKKLQLYSNPSNIDLRNRVYNFDLVNVVDIPGTGMVTPMWGIFRPRLKEFLTFASSYFAEIRIWSAGQYKYVHAITDLIYGPTDSIYGENISRPKSIKTYEDCRKDGNNIYKPLKDYCHNQNNCDLSNYLVLDDRLDTFSLNPENGIHIPAYEPKATVSSIMTDDIALTQLQAWLSLPEVMKAKDVRLLDKTRIFNTPLSIYQKLLHNKSNITFSEAPLLSQLDSTKMANLVDSY